MNASLISSGPEHDSGLRASEVQSATWPDSGPDGRPVTRPGAPTTRYALEQVSDGVFWARLDGRFEYVNDAACRLLGHSRAELLAMKVFDMAPGGQEPIWRTRWQAMNITGAITYDSDPRSPGSSSRALEITVNRLVHRGRVRFFGFIHDVSALRAAQRDLRDRERRYRQFLAHTGEGVWCLGFREAVPAQASLDEQLEIVHRAGYVSECNDAFARMRGFGSSWELTGMALSELLSPAEWRLIRHGMRKTGPCAAAEYRRRWPDGSVRYYLRNQIPIFDGGVLSQIWGTVLDTTDQRRAEQALRESGRRFRSMLETVELAALVLDYSGAITFVNDCAASLAGWTREEMLGRNWFDLSAPPEERARRKLEFAAALSTADLLGYCENRVLTRDGRIRLMVWDSVYLRDGSAAQAAFLGRDVTDDRELETRYRETQQLEGIGRLAGGVAHDFNNLLTVMLVSTEPLLDKAEAPDSGDARSNVVEIRNAVRKACGLNQQLLAFSRRQNLALETLDLNHVLSGAEGMLRRAIGEGVELSLQLEHPSSLIRGDTSQLTHVLLNLASNAREAMPGGGTLTIRTSSVRAGAGSDVPAGNYVRLIVSDTGTGIRAEHLPHIYEPFFTTKGSGAGSGLGLSTVYGIVRQIAGHIRVDTELGRGTTFSIWLPRAENGGS